MRRMWSTVVKMVPQNPLSSLNPSLRIGDQLAEGLVGLGGRPAQQRVVELLQMVSLADPERLILSYPHQLSGGMQQRIMIAMALAGEPDLLVLDEPTTNLDVTTEAVILDLVQDLIRERNTSVLYVSHSLGVVARICDRVAVLYAGELVEDAAVIDLYRQPLHPYTHGLLNSVPRIGENKHQAILQPIPGQIPGLDELPSGCVFTPRCPLAIELCAEKRPPLDAPVEGRRVRCHRWPEILAGSATLKPAEEAGGDDPTAAKALEDSEVVLNINNLEKHYTVGRSIGQILSGQEPRLVRAVDGIDLETRQGRTLGLVGESGSGKTTLARCVIGLAERDRRRN